MERRLQQEIKDLKQDLVKMAGMVETAIKKAIRSLVERNAILAQSVIEEDHKIDQLEIVLDNRCMSIMARHQPVAVDLRLIMASIKMNNDLERMGDHAVNIAEKALHLIDTPILKPLIDLPHMASLAQEMVKNALDSFVEENAPKAKRVCESDDLVDGLEHQINRELITYMLQEPRNITWAMDLSMIAKNIERIADLSTNICEEVIFIVEARTIKHHFEEQ